MATDERFSMRRPRPIPELTEDQVTSFWSRVTKGGDCWLWTGTKHCDGHGFFSVSGQAMLAHRLSFQLAYGSIPKGLCVLHSCDNPPCVNPAHLSLGTHEENMRERAERDRTHRWNGKRTGERNPAAKLKPDEVAEIRRLRGAMTQHAIAKQFGVSPSLISMIQTGALWNG